MKAESKKFSDFLSIGGCKRVQSWAKVVQKDKAAQKSPSDRGRHQHGVSTSNVDGSILSLGSTLTRKLALALLGGIGRLLISHGGTHSVHGGLSLMRTLMSHHRGGSGPARAGKSIGSNHRLRGNRARRHKRRTADRIHGPRNRHAVRWHEGRLTHHRRTHVMGLLRHELRVI